MVRAYDRIKSIWLDLEKSYESIGKIGETRKEFLTRISGVKDGIPSLAPVMVALEKEIVEDESIIEEGRNLYQILSVVQDNWKSIEASDPITNLTFFVGNLLQEYIKSKKTQGFDISSLNFQPRKSIHLDTLEMLVRFKAITGYVEATEKLHSSTKILPVEMQSVIASVGYSTVYYVREMINQTGVTDYLKLVHNLSIIHFENNEQNLVFLPRNLYRKTPAGCNVVIDGNTVRFPTTDYILFEGETIPYTDYHGILVLHTKYDYKPLH